MSDWKDGRRTHEDFYDVDHKYDIHHRKQGTVYFAIGFLVALVAFLLIFGG